MNTRVTFIDINNKGTSVTILTTIQAAPIPPAVKRAILVSYAVLRPTIAGNFDVFLRTMVTQLRPDIEALQEASRLLSLSDEQQVGLLAVYLDSLDQGAAPGLGKFLWDLTQSVEKETAAAEQHRQEQALVDRVTKTPAPVPGSYVPPPPGMGMGTPGFSRPLETRVPSSEIPPWPGQASPASFPPSQTLQTPGVSWMDQTAPQPPILGAHASGFNPMLGVHSAASPPVEEVPPVLPPLAERTPLSPVPDWVQVSRRVKLTLGDQVKLGIVTQLGPKHAEVLCDSGGLYRNVAYTQLQPAESDAGVVQTGVVGHETLVKALAYLQAGRAITNVPPDSTLLPLCWCNTALPDGRLAYLILELLNAAGPTTSPYLSYRLEDAESQEVMALRTWPSGTEEPVTLQRMMDAIDGFNIEFSGLFYRCDLTFESRRVLEQEAKQQAHPNKAPKAPAKKSSPAKAPPKKAAKK